MKRLNIRVLRRIQKGSKLYVSRFNDTLSVAAGFRTRRIKTEGSIGDKLKRCRIRKKITVAVVEESTRIRAKFILALEGDSWEQIPSEVYGRGYLETYATFLQLDREEIMRQYDKERNMYARHCQEGQVEFAPKSRLVIPRFLLTPRFFVIGGVMFALVGMGSIVFHQIHAFTAQPLLTLITPVEAKGVDGTDLLVSSSSINLTGKTTEGASVQVNSDPAQVDGDGTFHIKVALHQGVNPLKVRAFSINGKTTEQNLLVTVR